VLTGCSHHGSLNILAAIKDALPDRPIKALFGGFHLVSLPLSFTLSESKESLRALGQKLLQSGRKIPYVTLHGIKRLPDSQGHHG